MQLVADQHRPKKWFLCRPLGEQTEDRQADKESVRGRPGPDTEHSLEDSALWLGQAIESVEHRSAQLMERGEGELHLGFDRADVDLAATARARQQVFK